MFNLIEDYFRKVFPIFEKIKIEVKHFEEVLEMFKKISRKRGRKLLPEQKFMYRELRKNDYTHILTQHRYHDTGLLRTCIDYRCGDNSLRHRFHTDLCTPQLRNK